MRKILIGLLLTIAIVSAFSAYQLHRIIIVPEPSEFKIDVWLNKPEGSVYHIGEKIEIFFKANKNCYVLIYDITSDGKIELLFPNKYESSNYIVANRIYKIPSKNYSLKVSPPEGKEYVQIIASTKLIPLFSEIKSLGRIKSFPTLSTNPEKYVQEKIIPYLGKEWASDITFFYVGYRPTYGTLIVDSDPQGAYVYVDGSYKGKTPITLLVDEGTHYVVMYFEGGGSYEEIVSVKANEITRVFGRLAKTQIEVTTTPSGARVYVDDVYMGMAPITVDVEPGSHVIRVEKEGYATQEKSVSVGYGETTRVHFTLKSLKATLVVKTDPTRASVYVDESYKGITGTYGLTLQLSPGRHTIKVKKTDYETWEDEVILAPGERKVLEITLTPIPRYSTVYIDTTPEGAMVFIDGYYYGTTPITIQLDYGSYELTLVKGGYKTIVRTITINDPEEHFTYTMYER